MIFVAVIAAALFLSGSFLWLWLQAPQLAGVASMIFEWCQSFASLCVSATPVAMAALMWAAGAVLLIGLLYAGARHLRAMARSRRAFSKLPLADGKKSVVLIKDDSVAAAFTWGLLRPRIYLSTGLIKSLTRDELRSVVLHEAHHRRHKDPLRFFLASFLNDIFFYLPVGGYLASRLRFLRERAADDSVVGRTSDPLNLAGALVKVAVLGAAAHPGKAAAFFKGEPVEGRVRRLVEGGEDAHPSPPAWAVVSSIAAGTALVLSLLAPMAAHGRYERAFCTRGHCSTMRPAAAAPHAHAGHNDGAVEGMDCRTHCETAG